MLYIKPNKSTQLNKTHELVRHLVGCWVFNEGSAQLVFDSSGNGKHGNLVGTTIDPVAGDTGSALEFRGNGNNHRLNLGAINSANPLSLTENNEVTVVWKSFLNSGTLSSTFPRIIDKSTSGSGFNGWALWYNNNNARYELVFAEGNALGGLSDAKNTWYTMAMTRAGTAINSYDNFGRSASGSGTNSTVSTNQANAAIGNWNHATDRQWDGKLEFLYVFNKALPEESCKALINEPYQIFDTEQSVAPKFAPEGIVEAAVRRRRHIYHR